MPFDFEEYEAKCSQMTVEQLHKEWENYTRQISGGATGTAISSVAAPFTGGISIIGVGLSAPRIHNARKKREIIERFLQAQGTTHKTRKRDVLAPMAVSGILGTLTLGMASPGADMLMEAGATHGIEVLVASEVGTKLASHAVLEAGGQAIEHAHTKHDKKKGQEKLTKQQSQITVTEIDLDVKQQYEASIYSSQGLDEIRKNGRNSSKYYESQEHLSPQGYPAEKKYEPQAIPPPYSRNPSPQPGHSRHGTPKPPHSRPASPEPPSSPGASSIAPSYAAPSYHSSPPSPESNDLESRPRLPIRPAATPLQPPAELDADSNNYLLPPSAMPGALPHSYSAPVYAPNVSPHVYAAQPERYQPLIVETVTQSFSTLSHEHQLSVSEAPTPSSAVSNSSVRPLSSYNAAPQSYAATLHADQSSEHPRLPPRPTSQYGEDYNTQQKLKISPHPLRSHSPQPPPLQFYSQPSSAIQQPPSQPQTPQTPQPQIYSPLSPPPQQPAYFPPPPNSPPPVYAPLQPYNPQNYAPSNVQQGSQMPQGYGERIGGLPYHQPSSPNVQRYSR